MTVLPFVPDRDQRAGAPPPMTAVATGTFSAPSGARGTFAGTYRLERLRTESKELVAAGVLTGALTEPDGTPVAVGSRRHTAAAEPVADAGRHLARIGPLDVNVAGFMVSVGEVTVAVPRELPVTH